MKIRPSCFVLLLLPAFAVPSFGNTGHRYVLEDLGTLGGWMSRAAAINNQGQVVGDAETAEGHIHAFLWSPGEGMEDLGSLGGESSHAGDVNDAGIVVGESSTEDGETRAFRWRREGGMSGLPSLDDTVYSVAFAVNQEGAVVGSVETETGAHAVSWQDGELHIIPRLPGKGYVQPLDVNVHGDVVGQIQTHEGSVDSSVSHAFYFRRALRAENLVGFNLLSQHSGSAAVAVNDAGAAAGYIILDGRTVCASRFLWSGRHEELDDEDAMFSSVTDINEAGTLCGSVIMEYQADEEACIWSDGALIRLNRVTDMEPDWHLVQATGINDAGWIAGYGLKGDEERAFVLKPAAGAP